MAEPLQEGDIRTGIESGGHIRNAFIIEREVDGSREYVVYLRPSWRRVFLPLRTWQDRSDRSWRDLNRAMQFLRRDFGYRGAVPVYLQDDPELSKYRALGTRDGAVLAVDGADAEPGAAPESAIRNG